MRIQPCFTGMEKIVEGTLEQIGAEAQALSLVHIKSELLIGYPSGSLRRQFGIKVRQRSWQKIHFGGSAI